MDTDNYYEEDYITNVGSPQSTNPVNINDINGNLIKYGDQNITIMSTKACKITNIDKIQNDTDEETRHYFQEYIKHGIPNTHSVKISDIWKWLRATYQKDNSKVIQYIDQMEKTYGRDQLVEIKQKTPYVTADVLTFYIDENGKLSVIIGFKEDKNNPDNTGWVIPGTYVSIDKGDICFEDAAKRVLFDELKIDKNNIVLLQQLIFADDFMRDPRRSPCGIVYGALIKKIPSTTRSLSTIIGLPFSTFLALINRKEITQYGKSGYGLALNDNHNRRFPMIWQHDSWCAKVFSTQTGKTFIAEIASRCIDEDLKMEEEERKSILTLDRLRCPICGEIFNTPITLLCGHTFCEKCINGYINRPCPMCRVRIQAIPNKNIVLCDIVAEIKNNNV